jgi:hypothetical protein
LGGEKDMVGIFAGHDGKCPPRNRLRMAKAGEN